MSVAVYCARQHVHKAGVQYGKLNLNDLRLWPSANYE